MAQVKNYETYLRTPLFRAMRQVALDRTGGRCPWCGRTATEVHHGVLPTPNLDGLTCVEGSPEDLCPICNECHRRVHGHDGEAGCWEMDSGETDDEVSKTELRPVTVMVGGRPVKKTSLDEFAEFVEMAVRQTIKAEEMEILEAQRDSEGEVLQ